MSQNGKGSKARPFSVPPEVFEENWDRIFCRIPKSELTPKTKRKVTNKNTSDSEHELNKKEQ
jgi:hypothetical protein